ncbi:hypothetical protein chiPu_0022042 [Chiloscyllium punctatum]|uniref:Uncharacterized protein n=1 Tax=Chiloscyllium punctatum TaxID=137246 RepID=A0A401RI89_CHIPU|nr:hypothetical protein [Chiloscyllium punctatum]
MAQSPDHTSPSLLASPGPVSSLHWLQSPFCNGRSLQALSDPVSRLHQAQSPYRTRPSHETPLGQVSRPYKPQFPDCTSPRLHDGACPISFAHQSRGQDQYPDCTSLHHQIAMSQAFRLHWAKSSDRNSPVSILEQPNSPLSREYQPQSPDHIGKVSIPHQAQCQGHIEPNLQTIIAQSPDRTSPNHQTAPGPAPRMHRAQSPDGT